MLPFFLALLMVWNYLHLGAARLPHPLVSPPWPRQAGAGPPVGGLLSFWLENEENGKELDNK